MSEWDCEKALASGRAITRDGRMVLGLQTARAVLGGIETTILIGHVMPVKEKAMRPGKHYYTVPHWWTSRGGLGGCGELDLLNTPDEIPNKQKRR